jgi:hypothetical protein
MTYTLHSYAYIEVIFAGIVDAGKCYTPIVVVRGNEMVLVILGLLSSISTGISDLDCDSFKILINTICGLNISSKQLAC